MKPLITLAAFVILLAGCNRAVTYRPLKMEEIILLEDHRQQTVEAVYSGCDDPLSYTPDTTRLEDHIMRRIRVNFQFMDRTDSCCNFTPANARDFALEYLRVLNGQLASNDKMYLPLGNNTPVLPLRYRYELWENPADGKSIYFNYDDDLFPYIHKGKHRNHFSRAVIRQYRVGGDSVLNVFILPHHPDSLKRKGYNPKIAGIALGTDVKIAGMVENGNVWDGRGIFNHEIGHVLGLRHTWAYNDGCEDTPHHPNCWNFTRTGPCDSLVSNNVMDYNAHQSAFTPCQIGKIQMNFATPGSRQRALLIEDWCVLDTTETITVADTVVWEGALDLDKNVEVKAGGFLQIKCRASLPENAQIRVDPGGALFIDGAILHNDCGDPWGGVQVGEAGRRSGRVYATAPFEIRMTDEKRP